MILRWSLCKNNTTSIKASKIDAVTNNYGLYQLIQESIHTLDSLSAHIDLIFIPQSNLVIETVVC